MFQDLVPLLQNLQVNPEDMELVLISEKDVGLGIPNYDLSCYARVHSLNPFPLPTFKGSLTDRWGIQDLRVLHVQKEHIPCVFLR